MTEGSPIIRRRSLLRVVAWLVGVAAVLAALATMGLVISGAYIASPPREKVPFDSAQWKAARHWDYQKGSNPRAAMVLSLRAGRLLQGKTRTEVEALLGPPEGVDGRMPDELRVPRDVAAVAAQWDYEIGYAAMDYDFLAVQFDRKGHVRRVDEWQG
jgi:hypothetical protein